MRGGGQSFTGLQLQRRISRVRFKEVKLGVNDPGYSVCHTISQRKEITSDDLLVLILMKMCWRSHSVVYVSGCILGSVFEYLLTSMLYSG